jgi:hypothetical protein
VGSGAATNDQVLPSQLSTQLLKQSRHPPRLPTPWQLVALVHEMPLRPHASPLVGWGLGTFAQLFPFQRSAIEPPTAKQAVVLVQETAAPAKCGGVFTIDQVFPFQRSAPELPTAKQLVTLVHDTAPAPNRGGVFMIDQALPFHCSTSASPAVAMLGWEKPTATQNVALTHDTPSRSLIAEPTWFGLRTMDQVFPFQRSVNVFCVVPLDP